MDQHTHWNNYHAAGKHAVSSQELNEFAKEVASYFSVPVNIIELGCGSGSDAAYFAQQGHRVTAIDFSEAAITRDEQEYGAIPHLSFQVLDMRSGTLPFETESFDGVYARLSLHYYPHTVTKQLFQNIHRILTQGGVLAFMCKSTDDPLYGKGRLLEKDMFENEGHIRHFFDEDYTRSLLAGFHIKKLESKQEDLYGEPSAYIKVIARRLRT